MMERAHTHAHEYSHTHRGPHTPACTTIPTANVICTHPYVGLTRTARHVHTHIAHVLTPKALLTQSCCDVQAGDVHIHVQGFPHTILSLAYAHTIHACAHTSYVGLCHCAHTRAHTRAAHKPTQMPSRTHMRRNQIEELELRKSHGPCLSSWGSPCVDGHFLRHPLSPRRTLNSGQ